MNHFSNEETRNDDDLRSRNDTLVQRNTEANLNRSAGDTSIAGGRINQLLLAVDKEEQEATTAAPTSSPDSILRRQADSFHAESNQIPPPSQLLSNTADYRQSHRHIKIYQEDDDDLMDIVDFDSPFSGSLVGSSNSLHSSFMLRSGSSNISISNEGWGPPPTNSTSTPSIHSNQSIFPDSLFSSNRNNSSSSTSNSRSSQRVRLPYSTRSMNSLQQPQQQQPFRSSNSVAPQRSRSSQFPFRINNNSNTSTGTNNSSQATDRHNTTRHKKGSTTTLSTSGINNRKMRTVPSSTITVVESPAQYSSPSLLPLVNSIKADTTIKYTIYDYSSYSGTYHPDNVLVNEPTQQASRWSSGFHDHEQFITLEFDEPVIARTITFGKFCKGHVCNVKEFKIFGGMHPEEDLRELLHHGLKNDTVPETFVLSYQYNNMVLPVKYLKIVPLAAFGASFNYSIWYVEVRGLDDPAIVQAAYRSYENYREIETTRLCLKFFRQKNLIDVFEKLQKRTGIPLEHPMVSSLYQAVVVHAQYEQAEELLRQMYQKDTFQWYCDGSPAMPVWKLIEPKEKTVEDDKNTALNGSQLFFSESSLSKSQVPGPRGGHQMCIDVEKRKIYLLGGWDGEKDLADFWCFDIQRQQWRVISRDTRIQGGPSPRSCHKICFDQPSRSIFVLGGLMEAKDASGNVAGESASTASEGAAANDSRSNKSTAAQAAFYRYFIDLDQWVKISEDTTAEGGPELVYDHQMCIDTKKKLLYVFGGRTQTLGLQNYSGFYSYDLRLNQWRLLRNDDILLIDAASRPAPSQMSTTEPIPSAQTGVALVGEETDILKSRVGHSMLFDEASRSLLIFAGQRGNDYLTDLYQYFVDENKVVQVDHQRRHKCFFNKYSNSVLASTTIKKGPSSQKRGYSYDEFYYTAVSGSTGSYTQRVTMDEQDREMFVFSGYVGSNSGADLVKNTFWVYSMKRNEWTRVYHTSDRMSVRTYREREKGHQAIRDLRPWLYATGPPLPSSASSNANHGNSNTTTLSSTTTNLCSMATLSSGQTKHNDEEEDIYKIEPCPRFAHQMVYDPIEKTNYIFGGNPNDLFEPTRRLNDFWSLRLIKPDPSKILKKCIYMVRMQHLRELCNRAYKRSYCASGRAKPTSLGDYMDIGLNPDILKALDYLRSHVAPIVNHCDEEEVQKFHQICADLCLLQRSDIRQEEQKDNSYLPKKFLNTDDTMHIERNRLFAQLLEYIPEGMKEPLGNLATNAVKIA